MSSRLRFNSARQVFEAFGSARDDIATPPTDEPPLAFARRLVNSARPIDGVAFCAYLLPRREAVWWGCQCVRALLELQNGGDAALRAAEAWVREPEEETRRAALELGRVEDRRAPTTWLARAAGWSGGDIAASGLRPIPAPPHLTAKAVLAAIVLAGARSDSRWVGWISGCADGCIRFAEGGDARPRLVGAAAARPG